MNKLTIIKFIYGNLGILQSGLYLFYAVANKIDKWVWIGIGIILLEGIVLAILKQCAP
jgi:hypothetical protein